MSTGYRVDAQHDAQGPVEPTRFPDTFRLCERGIQMAKTHASYPPEFRRKMVDLVHTGHTAGELAREHDCSAQTIRNWIRQSKRDAQRHIDGTTSSEIEELRQLRQQRLQWAKERDQLQEANSQLHQDLKLIREKHDEVSVERNQLSKESDRLRHEVDRAHAVCVQVREELETMANAAGWFARKAGYGKATLPEPEREQET